jgi:hypothetical protein
MDMKIQWPTTEILGCVRNSFSFFMTIPSSKVGVHFKQATNMGTSTLSHKVVFLKPRLPDFRG